MGARWLLQQSFAAAILPLVLSAWYNPARDIQRVHPSAHQAVSAPCSEAAYVFERYVPSAWETEWLTNVKEYSKDICGVQRTQNSNSRKWVTTATAHREGATAFPPSDFDPAVWSHFEYRRGCTKAKGLNIPIEPAVGHLRHPYWYMNGNGDCVPDGETSVDVENREYLMPSALPASDFYKMYPGNAYLLDMGTGPSFNSSLRWFVDTYASRAVAFDRIWTWEAVPMANHAAFWQDVPPELRSKVNFNNVALTAKQGDPSNPVELIKSIYQPGDFIVLKLDIEGNEEVEGAIISALAQDHTFRDMIGEIFYELHFGKEIFGLEEDISLADTLHTFHKLRGQGVRLHFWP